MRMLILCLFLLSVGRLHAERPTGLPEAIEVKSGAVLFIDDYYIENMRGMTRTMHSPERQGDPVVGLDAQPWQPWITVVHNRERNRYRMWYNAHSGGSDPVNFLAHLESDDGIHWHGPHKKLFPIGFGASVIDEGPDFRPADERFKVAWFWLESEETQLPPPGAGVKSGMYAGTSPDGLRWKPHEWNSVLPFYWAAFKQTVDRSKEPAKWEQLARLRKDGYVSLDANGGTGRLRTKTLRFRASQLAANAEAEGGEVRVRILDAHDNPIKGFGFGDSQPVRIWALATVVVRGMRHDGVGASAPY